MKYRFYSRKNGWVGSDKIAKYFYSTPIEDCFEITKDFVDLSGKEIVNKIKELKLKNNIFLILKKN